MPTPDEIFDIVDDQDRVIGQATRTDVHANALKHRAVHVLLLNKRGELLVQERAPTKDTFPGCYDSSASGHLASGEDYDACAVRELHEELGLDLPPSAFCKQFKISACPETGWEFVWVYTVHGDHQLAINPIEISCAEFCPLPRLRRLVSDAPHQFAPAFVLVLGESERRGLLPRVD